MGNGLIIHLEVLRFFPVKNLDRTCSSGCPWILQSGCKRFTIRRATGWAGYRLPEAVHLERLLVLLQRETVMQCTKCLFRSAVGSRYACCITGRRAMVIPGNSAGLSRLNCTGCHRLNAGLVSLGLRRRCCTFFRLCLERIRHENQGIVVLAKSFLARLAGQIS